ncbi:hypothetical protein RZS08_61895, partial [Arthrospira platensis SPKY1]|nr:hypothetical protein [Arthrospira platensis SPKY1]
ASAAASAELRDCGLVIITNAVSLRSRAARGASGARRCTGRGAVHVLADPTYCSGAPRRMAR